MNERRQDILRAYHQMVLAQVPEAHIRLAFEEGDLENLQEDIMKAYWKHVREFLRRSPLFERRLDFLGQYFERPPHEVLDAIATAHFPQLTIAVTQPSFYLLRKWINELYRHANEEIETAV